MYLRNDIKDPRSSSNSNFYKQNNRIIHSMQMCFSLYNPRFKTAKTLFLKWTF